MLGSMIHIPFSCRIGFGFHYIQCNKKVYIFVVSDRTPIALVFDSGQPRYRHYSNYSSLVLSPFYISYLSKPPQTYEGMHFDILLLLQIDCYFQSNQSRKTKHSVQNCDHNTTGHNCLHNLLRLSVSCRAQRRCPFQYTCPHRLVQLET